MTRKFRMIHVDHYMSKPTSPFDDLKSDVSGRRTYRVPVIRVFGADHHGHKICLHVHGFYPYVAIEDKESSNPEFAKKVVNDIEKALAKEVAKFQRQQQGDTAASDNPAHPSTEQVQPNQLTNDRTPGISSEEPATTETDVAQALDLDEDLDPEQQIVKSRLLQERVQIKNLSGDQRSPIHRIERIKSYNYYGYHHKTEPFLKLHLYNPRMVKQLALIFEDGKVLDRFVPVFWAHLPYILLFFIDNNLRGMQFIEVDQLYWRKNRAPTRNEDSLASSYTDIRSNSVTSDTFGNRPQQTDQLYDEVENFMTDIEPISTCELEGDVRFEWITNRQRFGSKGNDDALRELWLDDQEKSQASDVIESVLPLFDVEKNYLLQLCESFEVNPPQYGSIQQASQRPKQINQPIVHSDDSNSLDYLQDRDVVDDSPEVGDSVPTTSIEESIVDTKSPEDEDEFSDDDEELLRVLPKIEIDPVIKIEKSHKEELPEDWSSDSQTDHKLDHKPSTSEIKQEKSAMPDQEMDIFADDDEFSDDDQFLMDAVIKTEKQLPLLPRTSSGLEFQDDFSNQEASRQSFTIGDNIVVNVCENSSSNLANTSANHADSHATEVGALGQVDQPFKELKRDEDVPQQVMEPTKAKKTKRNYTDNSVIDGRSVLCSSGAKTNSQKSSSSSREVVNHEYQFLCIMSMELHVTTRDELRPDPAYDPIEAVFYCIRRDIAETANKASHIVGLILTDPFDDDDNLIMHGGPKSPGARSTASSVVQRVRSLLNKTGLSLNDVELNVVDTELELIMTLVELARSYDPEILIGYEMEQLSWGYVLERSSFLNMSVHTAFSRVTDDKLGNNSKQVESAFVQPIMFTGRMVFSTWRIIRHEVNLNTCSYERIHHHALNERVPCFGFKTLTDWYNQNRNRWRVVDYYLVRVVGQMRILDKFDLIAKVSELARVYGTQFIDVITRGSQIGIESMMLRLAKLQNLTPLSPTVMQRHRMCAPEAIPLVMEPETNIYYDPVVVLDFQSLYPSVVIAYNYCYSTCLGKVMDLESHKRHQFGCSNLHVDDDELKRLLASDSVHVSPCGVAFVKKNVRHGVLPKMLSELIITRAMVKDQMKKNKKSDRPNRRLQRILDHRQHGLKMMANTTYGYAGASYTGRMPCVEIADSIVSKGRETLENAIELVESKPEWAAKVVYGDTDSMFIQFKNCDRDTAFKRAFEMVDAITQSNPYPIKMKFEKIYQPCVLQTKKRYCGFKYESPEQEEPEFEAKGIETVRRDCCPAAARMLEMALRIQFTTRNINKVKEYVQHQFVKIMSGKLSNIQDFIFARQYKPRDIDKSESVFVPAWQITKRLLATDPRAEPRFKERVPFIIIYGEPKTPLVNLAKTPIEVLKNLTYRVNADYYIQKIICPTLNRVFCTMNVDTSLWYKVMPHQNIVHRSHYLIAQKNQQYAGASGSKQSTMSQYFSPSHCPVCAKAVAVSDNICDSCRLDLHSSVIRLTEEITHNQRKLFAAHQLCRACSSLDRTDYLDMDDEYYNPCISYDCQNLFRFHQAKLDALNANFLSQILKELD